MHLTPPLPLPLQGNCGYGALTSSRGTGLDIAAISDQADDFQGSCGKCYEVKCHPGSVTDGFGTTSDRHDACRDPSAAIVVTITDACPCKYPDNAYSNERWCCGDQDHLDLSSSAFDKLAATSQGVIAVSFREVDCNHIPDHVAPTQSIVLSEGDKSRFPSSNCGMEEQCGGESATPIPQMMDGDAARSTSSVVVDEKEKEKEIEKKIEKEKAGEEKGEEGDGAGDDAGDGGVTF